MKQWWNEVKGLAEENKHYRMLALVAMVLVIIVISNIVGFTVTSIYRREKEEAAAAYNELCYKLECLADESFQNEIVAFIPCNEEIIFYYPKTDSFDSCGIGEDYSELVDLLQEVYGEWDIYLYDDINKNFSQSSSSEDDSEALRILAVERILGRDDPYEPVVRKNYAREEKIRNIIEDLK